MRREDVADVLKKLAWCAEPHITRDVRTVQIAEDQARRLFAFISDLENQVATLERKVFSLEQITAHHKRKRKRGVVVVVDPPKP